MQRDHTDHLHVLKRMFLTLPDPLLIVYSSSCFGCSVITNGAITSPEKRDALIQSLGVPHLHFCPSCIEGGFVKLKGSLELDRASPSPSSKMISFDIESALLKCHPSGNDIFEHAHELLTIILESLAEVFARLDIYKKHQVSLMLEWHSCPNHAVWAV